MAEPLTEVLKSMNTRDANLQAGDLLGLHLIMWGMTGKKNGGSWRFLVQHFHKPQTTNFHELINFMSQFGAHVFVSNCPPGSEL